MPAKSLRFLNYIRTNPNCSGFLLTEDFAHMA